MEGASARAEPGRIADRCLNGPAQALLGGVEGDVELVTLRLATAEAVGAGSLFALAPGKGFLAYRERDGTLHTYVQLAVPRDWLAGTDAADGATVSARVLAEFGGWAPELTALITDSETAPVIRPLCALPVGHRWARVPGVTLIGDAAHLAPPNGEGANTAMQDGAGLGQAIAAHPGDIEVALAEYEQAMFPRAAEQEARTSTTSRSATTHPIAGSP